MVNNSLNNLLKKPIGVRYNNYQYFIDNMKHNIGAKEGFYDGYGTPIGTITDPMYTIEHTTPWFKADLYKPMFENYLEYVTHTYLQLEYKNLFHNISEGLTPERIILDKVGVVENYDIMNAMASTTMGLYLDTHLGNVNNYFLSHTLATSGVYNSLRNIYGKSISHGLYDYIGLTNEHVDITSQYFFNEEGRVNIELGINGSPIKYDISDFGDLAQGYTYTDWIDSLNDKSLYFLVKNLTKNVYEKEDIINYTFEELKEKYRETIKSYYNLDAKYVNSFKDDLCIRFNFTLTENSTIKDKVSYTYAESRTYDNDDFVEVVAVPNKGVNYGIYNSNISSDNRLSNLIDLTNTQFKKGKLETLIARFHTSNPNETHKQEMQTANSEQFGLSHGRNLLKAFKDKDSYHVNITNENGYDNPYCRVWTYHYQYAKLRNAIRPFSDENGKILTQGELSSDYYWNMLGSQNLDTDIDEFRDGRSRLDKYGVLNVNNGMVNISPTNESIEEKNVKVENCMFSIENLAWKSFTKGIYGLSKEQTGPLGGRIMWFPPYNLKFSEQVNVNWNENSIIGRGENIYTYINTNRKGNLSFTIIVDHPQIINRFEKMNDNSDGDVDDVGSDEQRLLRFFAGCEVLSANRPKIDEQKIKYPLLPIIEEAPSEVPEEIVTVTNQVVFYVFYPNNYSGIDDRKSNSIVKPIDYLLNGIGTQRAFINNEIVDIPTQHLSQEYKVGDKTLAANGYESFNEQGVSHPKINMKGKNILKSNGKKGRKYGDDNPIVSNYVEPNKFGTTSEWHYRVDKRYETQKLLSENFWDTTSYKFNLTDNLDFIAHVANNNETENLYSLSEVALALDNSYSNILGIATERVTKLRNLLKDFKVKKISGFGMASSHGQNKWNKELNKDRFLTVVDWLQSFDTFKNVKVEMGTNKIGNVTSSANATSQINDKYAKLYRSAKIIIDLEKEEVRQIQEEASSFDLLQNSKTDVDTKYGVVKVPNSILTAINTQASDEEGNIDYELQKELVENYLYENPQSFFGELTEAQKNELSKWKQEVTALNAVRKINDSEVGSMLRYDNEADFFRTLETTNPFLHNKLVDKIKYFDPAFHSITPEGFNARLTFLQQCTRQGSTYSANENGMNTTNATNLAFGRPPICVLRVGDFYNTKIVIDNISFEFESWDLNTEGIGVQPMLCNVNLSFTFLGGQDLAGPISRLQNALSFNYYKNTSVYDNRSEMVIYDENGKINKFRGIKH